MHVTSFTVKNSNIGGNSDGLTVVNAQVINDYWQTRMKITAMRNEYAIYSVSVSALGT